MSSQTYDFANILFAGPCNLRCPYCIGQQIDPSLNRDNLDEFPPRNLSAFVTLLRSFHVQQVVLTGTTTDPQLYHHEARLIRWLRERVPGVQLSLHTNGQLALAKIDILNLYDRVSISLPSFDPVTYEKMTGSRRVPDLGTMVRMVHIPVKVSCVVHEHNADRIDEFLDRCREIDVRRLVLRQMHGDTRQWDILQGHSPVRTFRDNSVYDYHGMEVTYWNFGWSTSTSLNLFSDGTISSEYLLTRANRR